MARKPRPIPTRKKGSFAVVRDTLRFLFPAAWRTYPGYFIVGVLRMLLQAAAPFVGIFMTPLLIDELLGGRNTRHLCMYAAVLVIGTSAISLMTAVLGTVMEKYQEKFSNYFTEQISRRVMELDFQLTEDKQALDQIEAARTGMSFYSGGIHGIASQFFGILSNVISILGVIVLIAVHAPILFPLTAFLLAVTTLIRAKINGIEVEQYEKLSRINRLWNYLGWELTDFRYGKDIRLYGAEEMMAQKWDSFTGQSIAAQREGANRQLPWQLLSITADAARDFGSYLYLGILVITGKLSIGVFSQMLSCGGTFHRSMQNLIAALQETTKRCSYAYEYVKFMRYPPVIEKGTLPVKDCPHTITFRNVSFAYPNTERRVLDGVNITLRPGEHLSVVGLNGAGKTTFVKLLCRLYDPTEGEILLDGTDIRAYDYRQYMSLFAPVFQDFRLFSFSIRENIALDQPCPDEVLLPQADLVGLGDKLRSLPKGADTMISKVFDETGIEPSGGEQQKIAIARALFKDSPVVILDEPTAALDPVAEYDIYRQFSTLVGGKTAVYISHRLSSCRFCDRIAVFSGGTVAEYGTHEELVNKKDGIYAEMFSAQAQYYR